MRKLIVLLLCGILSGNIYAMRGYVSETYPEDDVVQFTDFRTENEWLEDGLEDWEKYDECLLVMYDNGTADVTDDIIIRAIYERSDLK